MKWFRHECSSSHDLKLHLLGTAYGAEGLGVYWGLLEQIGFHSDTFHIKVAGVSAESDQAYLDVLLRGDEPGVSSHLPAGANIPIIDLGALTRLVWTTEETLLRVIQTSVELRIFDQSKWQTYGVLHSPDFEHRADDYTRRRRQSAHHVRNNSGQIPEHAGMHAGRPPEDVRGPFEHSQEVVRTHREHSLDGVGTHTDCSADNVRTHVAHSSDIVRTHVAHLPDIVRTHSAHCPTSVRHVPEPVLQRDDMSPQHVRPEQTTEQKQIQIQKERQKQKEKESRRENLCSVPPALELSTVYPQPPVRESRDDAVLTPSAEYFTEMCAEFREIIREWNEREKSSIHWTPNRDELKKLFYGGDAAHKLRVCREASNLTGGKPDFPQLVIRALNLMLQASKKQRIQNPFGWVWSCLHGTPEGMSPWVHLLTAPEEARRVSSSRSPP